MTAPCIKEYIPYFFLKVLGKKIDALVHEVVSLIRPHFPWAIWKEGLNLSQKQQACQISGHDTVVKVDFKPPDFSILSHSGAEGRVPKGDCLK